MAAPLAVPVGAKGQAKRTVTDALLAQSVGSGSLPVFSSPSMIALMEQASCAALQDHTPPNSTSVGFQFNIFHLAPSVVGQEVTAEATVTAVEGKKITFSVVASDGKGKIGEGTHVRVIVNESTFLAKAMDSSKK